MAVKSGIGNSLPVCDMSRETFPTLIDMADNRQQTAKESKGFRNRLKKAFRFGSQSTHQSRSNSLSDVPVIGADPPVPSPVVGALPPVPSPVAGSSPPVPVPIVDADPPVPSPVVGAHPPVPSSPPIAEPPNLLMPLASPHPLQKQDQSTLRKLQNSEPNTAAFVSLLSVERMLEKRRCSSGCATQLKIRAFTTRRKTW